MDEQSIQKVRKSLLTTTVLLAAVDIESIGPVCGRVIMDMVYTLIEDTKEFAIDPNGTLEQDLQLIRNSIDAYKQKIAKQTREPLNFSQGELLILSVTFSALIGLLYDKKGYNLNIRRQAYTLTCALSSVMQESTRNVSEDAEYLAESERLYVHVQRILGQFADEIASELQ